MKYSQDVEIHRTKPGNPGSVDPGAGHRVPGWPGEAGGCHQCPVPDGHFL